MFKYIILQKYVFFKHIQDFVVLSSIDELKCEEKYKLKNIKFNSGGTRITDHKSNVRSKTNDSLRYRVSDKHQ